MSSQKSYESFYIVSTSWNMSQHILLSFEHDFDVAVSLGARRAGLVASLAQAWRKALSLKPSEPREICEFDILTNISDTVVYFRESNLLA